jgi:glycosyltransferase involved in cell wall biosynthesis
VVRRYASASRVQIAPRPLVAAVSRFHRRGAGYYGGRARFRFARVDRDALNPADLTFVLLTKNEARNLPAALDAIPHGARVLVVDAESSDRSVLVARERGAQTIVRPWAGFVATRRFALELVSTPWTFMLDADEVIEPELARALVALDPPSDVHGFTVRRVTYLCGQPILHGAWGAERLLRLFRTEQACLVAEPAAGGDADVHERWQVAGPTPTLAGILAHHSYPTIAIYREKFARYTALEARGVRGSLARLIRTGAVAVLRAPWLFFSRAGWRDGWRGAFVAFWSAAYPVAVAWKALRY